MSAFDFWRPNTKPERDQPLEKISKVTPSDTATLAFITRGFMLGADAKIAFRTSDGSSVGAVPCQGRVWYPICLTHVFTTGTSSVEVFIGA